jgi:glycosyltransferase involved in cell wall biosynthesis
VSPLEVIVVDDGSTDDPAAVLAGQPSVQLIRQENQGLSAARNRGWRASRGRYLVFLDADDLLRPRALEANLEQFARAPESAFVYGAYRLVDREGRPISETNADGAGVFGYERFLCGNPVGMHATVMYRRDRLEEAGGFDATLRACEDYDLLMRLARHHRVGFSPELLAEYRRHGDNMSEDVPRMLRTALQVLRRQRPHVTGNPSREVAFAEGFRELRRYYTREAMVNLVFAWRRGDVSLARLYAVGYVIVTSPAAALRVLADEARLRLEQRSLAPGRVEMGDLRRVDPINPEFGFDRGRPIDRVYIEDFVSRHAVDVRGRVLEIGDDAYTRRFGGGRVAARDVLHVDATNPRATIVGDIADGNGLPSSAFDCIILTQSLHLVFDMRRAVATLHRMLKPGGVLLVTVPGVSSIDRGDWGGTWYWSLTPAALERLLAEAFGMEGVSVSMEGNVLAAIAFLHGLADHELDAKELASRDPLYPVIVAARAVKGGSSP